MRHCAAIPEQLLEANCSATRKAIYRRKRSERTLRAFRRDILLDEIGICRSTLQTRFSGPAADLSRVGGNEPQSFVRWSPRTRISIRVSQKRFRRSFLSVNVVRNQLPTGVRG